MTDLDSILESIETVRRRWRLRTGLEAFATLVAIGIGFLMVWAAIWAGAGASESLAIGGRIAAVATLLAAGGWLGWRWRRRQPDNAQIALYVEEQIPSLGQSLVSAVHSLAAPPPVPGLTARVLRAARQGLDAVDRGRHLESRALQRASRWLSGLALGTVGLLLVGPRPIRDAAVTLGTPWRKVPVAPTFMVAVIPGNADVPQGGAAEIKATLGGFTADNTELVVRRDTTADWERISMSRDTAVGSFTTRLFDLDRSAEYFVEAAGVRSPTYRLTIVDLPAVRHLSATISYPKYTGLAPESIADAGDLAVLKGSTVSLKVVTTRSAKAAFLVVEGRPPIAMVPTEGGWNGSLRVGGDAFYRVDLLTDDNRRISGLNFALDALDDAPPSVRFSAPGRDTKVTSIEEVVAKVDASDDYGVAQLTLHLSVNGGRDTAIAVTDSSVRPLKELSASQTFFLEEWTLTAGDLVSYYAEAMDGAGQRSKSDMYFLEVRPFDKTYREAEQGGGGQQGGGESADGLSERQRQLVVGTFNVTRDSLLKPSEYAEDVTTLAIGQGRLRGDVGSLVTRLRQRQMAAVDTTFATISKELDSAVAVMQVAEETLGRRQARGALPLEQRALQHLQRAEAAYRDVMVAMGQQGGSGGGSANQRGEDLADLFELETDKLRNQYEAVERESGQQAERALDETLERLRRLASRQQQENDRLERAADAIRNRAGRSASGGGGGSGQRQLAQEADEEARHLERLARERGDQSLEDAARRLKQAAEQMRRAASGDPQQGATQGSEALERLKSTAQQLERSRSASREGAIRRLETRANEIRREQRETADQASGLPSDPAKKAERIAALGAKKDALASDVERLEADAERLSRESAKDQPNAARKLAEAAQGIRDNRIRDKLAFSKDLLRRASPDYVKNFEQQIGANLEAASEQLKAAASALGTGTDNRQARALERARELVRGLETLKERARAAQQNQPNGRSQPGEKGPDGQADQQQKAQPGGAGSGRLGQSAGEPVSSGQPNGPSGRFDGDRNRQFSRELRARRQAAESLRADLRAMGQETRDLDKMLSEFRALDNPTTFTDPRGLARLEQDLIAGLKEIEFALWRRFGEEGEQRPALGASARVPPQYRELVEEYYRSLARLRSPPP